MAVSDRMRWGLDPRASVPEETRIRDACGVGVVADIKGRRSHDIVKWGLEVLVNLGHRGALNADPETGDGAGILVQMPDAFFRSRCASLGIALPSLGEYAVGTVFLPTEAADRSVCELLIEGAVAGEGQEFLGWRDVPVDNSRIGRTARERQPVIRQFFVGWSGEGHDETKFENALYVIRNLVEWEVHEARIESEDSFYICSLSSNRVVYKGMLTAAQLAGFYADLRDESLVTGFAMVHSRFSTNTLGSWKLAHPYRLIVHNGEINTLRGNINWMHARQAMFDSPEFKEDIEKLFPIIMPGASDTASFDNVLELLLHTGRSLPHALMMMIPEAWERHERMSREKKEFYEYHAALMEPWDGPALIVGTDGLRIAAILDRNGLRPFRYTVTKDDLLVMGSETGVLDIPPEEIAYKGRLSPGRMFLVDPTQERIIGDDELKHSLATRRPYGEWLRENRTRLKDLPEPSSFHNGDPGRLRELQRAFGYTAEDVDVVIGRMATSGAEPVGSMGNDAPLAVLSHQAPLLFNYFKQLFAQVSNPPLDAIREELVTSMETFIGSEQNLFDETPLHCRQLRLPYTILTNRELEQIRLIDRPGLRAKTLPMLFDVGGEGALERAMERLLAAASDAAAESFTILVLSDRGVDEKHVPIPSLLATAGVHHHLIREGTRMKVGIVVESAEPREVHHFAALLGYGAGAVNPYLAIETVDRCVASGTLNGVDAQAAAKNYLKALDKGVLKTMSKMGISTLQSYRGAQIFEAVGLNRELVDRFFTWTPSKLSGVGLDALEREARERHARGYPQRGEVRSLELGLGGQYQWFRGGEHHMYNPDTIAKLQYAARNKDEKAFREFADIIDNQYRETSTIRGLLEFKKVQDPVPLDDVEPADEIVKRFATGAISLGSISKEAHETVAIAMNRIGGRSNTGEGGEDHRRFKRDASGDSRNSAIKQVASARFGATISYLVSASDLQIKMAQGAKPGEGGQLPGWKVDEYIGWIRHTTPGVELISPPPHHDIYSIEDLAQLIHDLKNANPKARVQVKLVSEVGVGTIAAGVSKGHGDVVLISGDSGGTGASPLSSIKHAGLPWELGLAETQQVLVENDLRGRIVVQTDGQLKTGRDVAIACLLGAEEFGFATAPLVVLGCIMLRNCHLNTCSVGIATQDPELRKRFAGKPEWVVNFFHLVAEDLRRIMAELGFRKLEDMVGRVDLLDVRKAVDHWKGRGLDISAILRMPKAKPGVATHCCERQDHGLEKALDVELIELARPALEEGKRVSIEKKIRNSNRTVCTMLSGEVARRYGVAGLPDYTIRCSFEGSAGQSFGAFLAPGIHATVEGDANDYFGKGMSGGGLVLVPPRNAAFAPGESVIGGNVFLYGATGGKAFIRGMVGERFCVRNSGAQAVVEGVADHGCEYMTSGVAVILGPTGRNFAAGMSGGVAFVLDEDGDFQNLCNREMVDLEPVEEQGDIETLRGLIEEHLELTGSTVAARLLGGWESGLAKFVKVMPRDFKRVTAERAARSEEQQRRAMELIYNG